jgi:hypothetical protein
MRIAALASLVLAFLLAAALPAAANPPLDYQPPPSDPPGAGVLAPVGPGTLQGHPTSEPLAGVGAFQRLPMIDESGFIVVDVRKGPYWKAGQFDPVLTNACRLGDFTSMPLNRMIVRFVSTEGPGALQVILPDRRHLLVDKRSLARPGEIYYFLNATYTTCQVWVGNPAGPPRRLNAAGTSLGPADPKALAKKKALFKSWEQRSKQP